MKKNNPFLFSVFALAVATSANAQATIGLFGGPNISFFSGEVRNDPDLVNEAGFNFSLGTSFDFRLSQKFSMRFDVVLSRKNATSTAINGIQNGAVFSNNLTALEIPLFLKFNFSSGAIRPYAMAGPSLAFVLNSNIDADNTILGDLDLDTDDQIRKVDLGLAFGSGLAFGFGRASLFLEGRYLLGFTDLYLEENLDLINRIGNLDEVDSTRSFQIVTGLAFSFGRY